MGHGASGLSNVLEPGQLDLGDTACLLVYLSAIVWHCLALSAGLRLLMSLGPKDRRTSRTLFAVRAWMPIAMIPRWREYRERVAERSRQIHDRYLLYVGTCMIHRCCQHQERMIAKSKENCPIHVSNTRLERVQCSAVQYLVSVSAGKESGGTTNAVLRSGYMLYSLASSSATAPMDSICLVRVDSGQVMPCSLP